jgi:hypothetical protein
MTIFHQDGTTEKAMLLAYDKEVLRVAVGGEDDCREYRRAGCVWISERGEAVAVEFEWQRAKRVQAPDEADCVCSKPLAAQLIRMLRNPELG